MMKLTDYLAAFLAKQGIDCVFGVTGGAVVHIFDSCHRTRKLKTVFCHHEQAAALAAASYARIKNDLGCAIVTTGPGGTNALTGLCGAWLDSVPCLFISGQARLEHTTRNKPVRQIGSQQIDIIKIVEPMTKYSVMIDDVKTIKYHLQKAVYLAKSGRPGPVWIDLPLNFQWAQIEPDQLEGFAVPQNEEPLNPATMQACEDALKIIASSQRPMIVAGYGIRLSGGAEDFEKLIQSSRIPFVCTWNTSDILPTDHLCYMGRIGVAGQRGANLAVQNSDCVVAIGSHLCMTLTGGRFDGFARGAKKIIADIDTVELENANIKTDLPIKIDAKVFLKFLSGQAEKISQSPSREWRDKCKIYKSYNAVDKNGKKKKGYVDPYVFLDLLSDFLNKKDTLVVDGGGTALYIPFQAMRLKKGQRMTVSGGISAMGTGLPESVGACMARKRGRTVCFVGDGSMQFNIHELQTIVHHRLPIKIIIFNNGGYLAMRHTQDGFLGSRYVGSNDQGGLSLPDFQKISKAYGIKSLKIRNFKEAAGKLKTFLTYPGPYICEIMIDPAQALIPTMGFKKNPDGTASGLPLEDMAPYLERDEFIKNMIVPPLKESLA